jgi:recombination protein RecR
MRELEELIEALEQLPTIGRKSATRLALHIVKNRPQGLRLAKAIQEAVSQIGECQLCGGLAAGAICEICKDEGREPIVALVESWEDVERLEQSGEYHGYYFLFPEKPTFDRIQKLREFIESLGIGEVIIAFTPSLANRLKGEQIKELLQLPNLQFTILAQGVPTGVKFENIDTYSLISALKHRYPL